MADVNIGVGKIYDEEPVGKHPSPRIPDLRHWDKILLKRYKPFYMPVSDVCDHCTYGKCDLTDGKHGACGIQLEAKEARRLLIGNCIGASAHLAHARDLIDLAIEKKGPMFDIKIEGVTLVAPICEMVTGSRPSKLIHLRQAVEYCEEQIAQLLSSTHIGQENDNLDYESKSFQAGLVDSLSMEVADVSQIVAYDLDCKPELVDIGFDTDLKKPFILFIGHNIKAGAATTDYIKDNSITDVEVGGLCCTSHDMSRHHHGVKVIGSISEQLAFVKSGIADVVVIDEQCIRGDVVEMSLATDAVVVGTNDKIMAGLPDISKRSAKEAKKFLLSNRVAYIDNLDVIAEVVIDAARENFKKRKGKKQEFMNLSYEKEFDKCVYCHACRRGCPHNLEIDEAIHSRDIEKLKEVARKCIYCGKCESACPEGVKTVELMMKVLAEETFKTKTKRKIRAGSGPVKDFQIREVGAPVVFGEVPGIIAIVGCPNHHEGAKVAKVAEEFVKRRFIVLASGCAAMQIAQHSDLYEQSSANLEGGCLINTGSCVSNAHIIGAAVKIPAIFGRKDIRGNYDEIADYILNRVGAVGIAFGAMSQKASSIASGVMRLGIPVILGPAGMKYGRLFVGDKKDKDSWKIYDNRQQKTVDGEPIPEHLLFAVQTIEESIVLASKLCFRPNDTAKGRQMKLLNYIDLYKKYFGKEPGDIAEFVRNKADIPQGYEKKIKVKDKPIIDPTLLKE